MGRISFSLPSLPEELEDEESVSLSLLEEPSSCRTGGRRTEREEAEEFLSCFFISSHLRAYAVSVETDHMTFSNCSIN